MRDAGGVMGFFSQLQHYWLVKQQVEEKWDVITLLILLLFFLVLVALQFALTRPEGFTRKVLVLAVALPVAYGGSTVLIQQVLGDELRKSACLELMGKMPHTAVNADQRCQSGNPIKLNFVNR